MKENRAACRAGRVGVGEKGVCVGLPWGDIPYQDASIPPATTALTPGGQHR